MIDVIFRQKCRLHKTFITKYGAQWQK